MIFGRTSSTYPSALNCNAISGLARGLHHSRLFAWLVQVERDVAGGAIPPRSRSIALPQPRMVRVPLLRGDAGVRHLSRFIKRSLHLSKRPKRWHAYQSSMIFHFVGRDFFYLLSLQ